jgi:hypothetical protein
MEKVEEMFVMWEKVSKPSSMDLVRRGTKIRRNAIAVAIAFIAQEPGPGILSCWVAVVLNAIAFAFSDMLEPSSVDVSLPCPNQVISVERREGPEHS